MQIEISSHYFELMDREFKCPICKSVYLESPKWLPCQHVYCKQCLQRQITVEKMGDKLTKCAECKVEFSHRNLKENKKFNRLLELWRNMRTKNDLNTQIPERFKPFDPQAAIMLMKQQKANQSTLIVLEEEKSISNGQS
jgi:hypothetical protein